MSAQESGRTLDIIIELLNITRKMSKSSDPDFLVEAIDKRGELMAEYDRLKASDTQSVASIEKHKAQISDMINEIIELDKKINRTLFSLYQDAKINLKNSNQSNKILNYTNNAISSTGSYMDYKE